MRWTVLVLLLCLYSIIAVQKTIIWATRAKIPRNCNLLQDLAPIHMNPLQNNITPCFLNIHLNKALYFLGTDQPRGLVVRVSDYWSWGPGFDGLGRLVEFRFKAPPDTTSSSITTHTSPGQRNCASWASQPQKSVAMPRREDHEVHKRTYDGIEGGGNFLGTYI